MKVLKSLLSEKFGFLNFTKLYKVYNVYKNLYNPHTYKFKYNYIP